MSITLAIDTSHHVAVGIARDGEPLACVVVEDTRSHVEELLPSVEAACAEAGIALTDIDDYAVGMGPGPFTGLRVGIATARTLAAVGGLPLHPVCSLDVVARQWADAGAPGRFVVAADARRRELYWREYTADGAPVGAPQVSAPDALPALPVAGAVPEGYRDLLDCQGPDALDPATLAAAWPKLEVAGDEPYYLRAADATVPGKPKSAFGRLRAKR